MTYIHACDAKSLLSHIHEPIHLLLTDPPFFGVVSEDWDNAWKDDVEFAEWLCDIFTAYLPKMAPDGSIVFFGGVGSHGKRGLFRVMQRMEQPGSGFTYRNFITWKKRRAYGKEFDYLFCREEIVWYSVSEERTQVRFNIPLTAQLRGYAGFSKKYGAKSPYKRVSNVMTDLPVVEDGTNVIEDEPELFKTKRNCQKPIPLMQRLVATHSREGDLVVDCFAGTGATGVAAVTTKRRFIGCEKDVETANKANAEVKTAYDGLLP